MRKPAPYQFKSIFILEFVLLLSFIQNPQASKLVAVNVVDKDYLAGLF